MPLLNEARISRWFARFFLQKKKDSMTIQLSTP